jgi:hypothetical protein
VWRRRKMSTKSLLENMTVNGEALLTLLFKKLVSFKLICLGQGLIAGAYEQGSKRWVIS